MRKFIVILVGGLIVLQLFTFLTWSNKHNFIPLSKCDCASPGFNVAASLRYMDVVPESKVQLPRLDSQIPPLMSSARQTQPGDTESRKGTLLGPLFTNKNRMVINYFIKINYIPKRFMEIGLTSIQVNTHSILPCNVICHV